MKSSRFATLVTAGLLSAVLITGCSNPISAGTAASVGSSRISETEVAEQVNAVLSEEGKAPNTADAKLTQEVIQRLILVNLLQQVATESGAEVTKANLDSTKESFIQQAGGEEQLKQALLQQGVPGNQIDSVVQINALVSAIGTKLASGANPNDASTAVFQAVVKKAEELGVNVNPRFGTWDAAQLKLGPLPNDLSVPAQS